MKFLDGGINRDLHETRRDLSNSSHPIFDLDLAVYGCMICRKGVQIIGF